MVNMRKVDAHDLELYAINTGSFYPVHKWMATQSHPVWVTHVRSHPVWVTHVRAVVLPQYCREIEPVWATSQTVDTVASALGAYYANHERERQWEDS
jgi:hypothetical protein